MFLRTVVGTDTHTQARTHVHPLSLRLLIRIQVNIDVCEMTCRKRELAFTPSHHCPFPTQPSDTSIPTVIVRAFRHSLENAHDSLAYSTIGPHGGLWCVVFSKQGFALGDMPCLHQCKTDADSIPTKPSIPNSFRPCFLHCTSSNTVASHGAQGIDWCSS